MRLKLLLTIGGIFVLIGVLIDGSYQRSTPGAVHVQGRVIGFQRPHPRQVYPIFEFTDDNGRSIRSSIPHNRPLFDLRPRCRARGLLAA